jgi:Arc/MetJ-type ribon-helix-helix transcriptional regulator
MMPGMSVQMTMRISDEAAAHIDEVVATGAFSSRAAYVTAVVERDAQRQRSVADLQTLSAEPGGPYVEFDDMHAWADRHRPAVED